MEESEFGLKLDFARSSYALQAKRLRVRKAFYENFSVNRERIKA